MINDSRNSRKSRNFFAGDSGDGIQLTGSQFKIQLLYGNDLSTFPDFPLKYVLPRAH